MNVRSQEFSYDLQGRMETVLTQQFALNGTTVQSRQRTSFEYDSSGTRIASVLQVDSNLNGSFNDASDTATRTEFLTEDQNHTGYSQVAMETEFAVNPTTGAIGNPLKRFVYTIGHDQITQTTFLPLPNGGEGWGEGETHFFGTDGHGSVRVLYQIPVELGEFPIAQVYHYDAYGNMLNNGGTTNPTVALLTRYLYNSEAFDFNIQFLHLRARPSDATTGRYPTIDPFFGNLSDPQSLHKYAYVHGDPVMGVDPSGAFVASISITAGSIGGLGQQGRHNGAVVGVGAQLAGTIGAIGAYLELVFAIASTPAIAAVLTFSIAEILQWRFRNQLDLCQLLLSLQPNTNDFWLAQRAPIAGNTTVRAGAFRLDAGRSAPAGQAPNPASRLWVRTIGRPRTANYAGDDAGHVIAQRFGGSRLFNGPNGNLFPQNLSINRGLMRITESGVATLHSTGNDVCSLVVLDYATPVSLRPHGIWYLTMFRHRIRPNFIVLPPVFLPNP